MGTGTVTEQMVINGNIILNFILYEVDKVVSYIHMLGPNQILIGPIDI